MTVGGRILAWALWNDVIVSTSVCLFQQSFHCLMYYYTRCRPSGLHEVHYFYITFDAESILTSLTRRRRRALLNPVTDSSQASPHIPVGPKKDYSLKEGQTFSISIPGHSKPSTENSLLASSSSGSTTSGSSAIPFLPPPPAAPRKR